MYRPYARAPIGLPAEGKISGRKYQRTSIVAGKCGKRIVAPLQYSGTMDSVLFEYWFERMLLKETLRGSIFVMDNARFHRRKTLEPLAEKAGCKLLFLPPYSPDLNPIENFWAYLKKKLRKILSEFNSLDDAIHDVFKLE